MFDPNRPAPDVDPSVAAQGQQEGHPRRQVLALGGLGAALLAASPVLAACTASTSTKSTSSAKGAVSGTSLSKSDRFVLVGLLAASPFWTDIKAGAQDAANLLGVTFEFTGPQAFDTEAQVSTATTVLGTKPKGMILPAFSAAAMVPVINSVVAAGVPVVCIDSDAPDSKRDVFVGTDHFNLGTVMGQQLVKYTNGTAKIGVATVAGQANLEQRIAGIMSVFASNPGMKIVQTVDNGGTVEQCATVVAAMLQAHPDLTAIACVNDTSAGVATALQQTNRVGKVVAVTSDIHPPVVAAIKAGVIKATMVQRTYTEGFFAVLNLAMLANPTAYMTHQASYGVATLPRVFSTGTIVVDSNNVAAYS